MRLLNSSIQLWSLELIDVGLKLCYRCGFRLKNLYMYYHLFIQLNTLNSEVSKLINLGLAGAKNPLATCQPSDPENSEENLSNSNSVEESITSIQIDPLCSIAFKVEYEDTVPFNTPTDVCGGESSSTETTWNHDTIIKTEPTEAETPCLQLHTVESSDSRETDSAQRICNGTNTLQYGCSCNKCTEKIEQNKLLMVHSMDCGPDPKEVSARRRKRHQCPHCPKAYRDLKIHIDTVHLRLKRFKCDICNRNFASAGACFNHKRNIHVITSKKSASGARLNHKKNVNMIASKKSASGAGFNHKRNIHVIASKKSTSGANHKKNVHISPSKKSALCTICGNTYYPPYLKAHMATHFPPNKIFKCKLCDRGFTRVKYLKQHSLVHTEERNHLCKTCGRGFKTVYQQGNHEKLKSCGGTKKKVS